MFREFIAKNVPEFINRVQSLTGEWFEKETTWGPWFRGHRKASWPLVPTLYRYGRPKRGIRILEDELRQEFVVRAPSLSTERPQNTWEWYFAMQHYGAPTRLLDWTEGALIGLYFAVRDKTDDEDAAVWVLEPWKLNEFVLGEKEVIPPGADESFFGKGSLPDSALYKPWLPGRYEQPGSITKELPIAVYPTHFARRISSQRSCFTIHGSAVDGFERLPRDACRYVAKILVPASNAHEIERTLSVSGIDEVTIFPDLDGLGRYLTTILRDECS
jgi:hypothetical protein